MLRHYLVISPNSKLSSRRSGGKVLMEAQDKKNHTSRTEGKIEASRNVGGECVLSGLPCPDGKVRHQCTWMAMGTASKEKLVEARAVRGEPEIWRSHWPCLRSAHCLQSRVGEAFLWLHRVKVGG